MYSESKIKESELVRINLIEMSASISDVSNARNSYTFFFKAGTVNIDENPGFLILRRYNAEYTGQMRLFNGKIIDDMHYIPINILYIMYKIANAVKAESIKITYNADAKVDKRYYDLISDYFNPEMSIIIDNDKVYQYKKNDAYNEHNHIKYTDYDSILEQISMLRIAKKLIVDDDLSDISTDGNMKSYIYNITYERIACEIQRLLFAYRDYVLQ